MNISDLFPRKYATGADLAGKAHELIISEVVIEKMRPVPSQPPVEKPVVFFTNASKGVILNRTLAEQISQALKSTDTDDWKGKKITLGPVNLTVAGKDRIAIRVVTS